MVKFYLRKLPSPVPRPDRHSVRFGLMNKPVRSGGPEAYFPGPPFLLYLQTMPHCATISELVTLGTLETGADPVEALYSIRRVDAFGFVALHVGDRGLAGGFYILITTVSRI